MVYSLRRGRKGPTLVRFHFIKKKKGEVGVGPKGPATKVPRNNKKKKKLKNVGILLF